MKKNIEIWFDDLGYFSKGDCETLKERVKGSYYNLEVIYSNYAGNYTIGVTTDYDYEAYGMTHEELEKAVRIMFIRKVIDALYQMNSGFDILSSYNSKT